MKQKSFSPNQWPAGASPSAAALATSQRKTAIVPSPDEIAKRAYFSYVNEGSQPGHEERHWLEAEAQLFGGGIDCGTQSYPGSWFSQPDIKPISQAITKGTIYL